METGTIFYDNGFKISAGEGFANVIHLDDGDTIEINNDGVWEEATVKDEVLKVNGFNVRFSTAIGMKAKVY